MYCNSDSSVLGLQAASLKVSNCACLWCDLFCIGTIEVWHSTAPHPSLYTHTYIHKPPQQVSCQVVTTVLEGIMTDIVLDWVVLKGYHSFSYTSKSFQRKVCSFPLHPFPILYYEHFTPLLNQKYNSIRPLYCIISLYFAHVFIHMPVPL